MEKFLFDPKIRFFLIRHPSSAQGPAQCARVSPPPGLVDPAAAGVRYTMWDDPDLAARLEAEQNMRAVMVVAQQNEMVDRIIRSEHVTTSGVPAALQAFVPNGAELCTMAALLRSGRRLRPQSMTSS